jgi:hypothetical protein
MYDFLKLIMDGDSFKVVGSEFHRLDPEFLMEYLRDSVLKTGGCMRCD